MTAALTAEGIREAVGFATEVVNDAMRQIDPVLRSSGNRQGIHAGYLQALIAAASAHADSLQPIVHGSDAVPPLRSGGTEATPTDATIERLRKLIAKATPGPWVDPPERESTAERPSPYLVYAHHDVTTRHVGRFDYAENNLADKHLIAALRNEVPALLDELERLRTHTPAANVIDGEKLHSRVLDALAILTGIASSYRLGADQNNLELAIKWLKEVTESTLTEPVCTKTVEVWRVEWAVRSCGDWRPCADHFDDEAKARHHASHMERDFDCVRVTGPHFQTVPA